MFFSLVNMRGFIRIETLSSLRVDRYERKTIRVKQVIKIKLIGFSWNERNNEIIIYWFIIRNQINRKTKKRPWTKWISLKMNPLSTILFLSSTLSRWWFLKSDKSGWNCVIRIFLSNTIFIRIITWSESKKLINIIL